VFIDACKHDYGHYYDAVLPNLADHGLIVADNVLWRGQVLDDRTRDEETIALQAFTEQVQADPRVDNALLTVGDGLLLIWKRAGSA
jgi:predicted O-methyltransferase YrrM